MNRGQLLGSCLEHWVIRISNLFRISSFVLRVSLLFHLSGFKFRISSFRSAVLLLLVVSGIPARAEAHLNSTGMGPIYDGLIHFLTSPEDLVPAFALALLAGLRGAPYGRRASFTLPVAWLLGSLFGLTAAATTGSAVLSSFWFLSAGRVGDRRRQTILACDDRLDRAARSCSRLLERHGDGPLMVSRCRSHWTDVRGVCPDRACRRVRGSVARALGTNRRARRRKLDRRQWLANAGLVISRKLMARARVPTISNR